jgi:hypothetical protein
MQNTVNNFKTAKERIWLQSSLLDNQQMDYNWRNHYALLQYNSRNTRCINRL